MENKAFKLISDSVESALKDQKFIKKPTDLKNANALIFESKNIAYRVSYYLENKKYELASCEIKNGEYDQKWKSISVWKFDPYSDKIQDAQDIANDFFSTLQGPKQISLAKSNKNKSKSDESNADPLFLMNRLVNVFPDLKAEIKSEKEHYEAFRGVIFTKEQVIPLIPKFLNTANSAAIKKFSKILSDMYSSGDLDTRGIITYVILNEIEAQNKISKIWNYLSTDLQKAFENTRKLKGKNIKAEKKKKPSKLFSAATLNEMGK